MRILSPLNGVSLTALALLLTAGCADFGMEYGGGASVTPEVTYKPAELGGDVEPVTNGDTTTQGDVATVESDEPGSWVGRVLLAGSQTALPPRYAKDADIKDKEVCAAEDVPDERLVLGEENGVANVFIYMKKVPRGTPKVAPPSEPLFFDQKNCRFTPHCLIVPVGQTLKVLSGDPVAHNTHTNPKKNNGVSNVVPANDREGVLELIYTRPEDPFSVTCDFHAWMNAYHLPLDHSFAAITDENGRFEIAGIPPGTHEFVVWHEAADKNLVERKFKVVIKSGTPTSKDVSYPVDKLSL